MPIDKQFITDEITAHMKDLGVFKPEYNSTISIYIDMLHQYQILTEQFKHAGYQVEEEYTNKAGATNMRKTPVYGALEKLRMDLVAYSNVLCLNPKSHESVKIEKGKGSSLAEVLNKLE